MTVGRTSIQTEFLAFPADACGASTAAVAQGAPAIVGDSGGLRPRKVPRNSLLRELQHMSGKACTLSLQFFCRLALASAFRRPLRRHPARTPIDVRGRSSLSWLWSPVRDNQFHEKVQEAHARILPHRGLMRSTPARLDMPGDALAQINIFVYTDPGLSGCSQ